MHSRVGLVKSLQLRQNKPPRKDSPSSPHSLYPSKAKRMGPIISSTLGICKLRLLLLCHLFDYALFAILKNRVLVIAPALRRLPFVSGLPSSRIAQPRSRVNSHLCSQNGAVVESRNYRGNHLSL